MEAAIARAMRLLGHRRTRGPARGQALAEFALVLPVFLLIFFAIIQFGVLLAAHIGLTNAVREVARYGSTVPTSDGAPAGDVALYLLDTALPRNVATYSETNLGGSSVTYCRYQDTSGAYSVRLTVEVTYDHPLFVPLVSVIIDGLDGSSDNAFALVTSEAMRVENPPLGSAPPLPDCP
jgi:Flp pilus assembly protein TadG